MRRHYWISLLLAVLVFALAFAGTISQNKVSFEEGGQWLYFSHTVTDSLQADTSAVFMLNEYDDVSWSTYPFMVLVNSVTSPANADSGTIADSLFIQCSWDVSTWTTIDTMITTTYGDTVISVDLNNTKRPYYRIVSATTNAVAVGDTTMTVTQKWWTYQD